MLFIIVSESTFFFASLGFLRRVVERVTAHAVKGVEHARAMPGQRKQMNETKRRAPFGKSQRVIAQFC